MRSANVVNQEDLADCGLACLAMAASTQGRHYDLATLKSRFPTTADGTPLPELLAAAQELGFSARALRAELEGLKTLRLPLILHWGFNHYVLLHNIKRDQYTIIDPASGRRILDKQHVSRLFTGVAVELKAQKPLMEIGSVARLRIRDLILSAPHPVSRLVYCMVLSALAMSAIFMFPFYFHVIMEFGISADNGYAISIALFLSIILIAVTTLFSRIKHSAMTSFSADLDQTISSALNTILFRTSYAFFMRKTPGMVARYYHDLRRVRQAISEGVIEAVIDASIIIALCVATFTLDVWLGIMLLIVMISYMGIFIYLQRAREDYFRQASALDNYENNILMDNLRNIQAIKLNSLESTRSAIWHVAYRRAATALSRLNEISSRSELYGNSILAVARCLLVAYAATGVIDGRLTFSAFLSFTFYQAFLTLSLSGLMRKLVSILDIRYTLKDMSSLVAAERDTMVPSLQRGDDLQDNLPRDDHGKVESSDGDILSCNEVAFRFDKNSKRLFRRVSFDVKPGEFVAITGESGCGKSTLLRVLMGLLPSDGGEIQWFQRPLHSWSRRALVAKVATVMQEDQLFSGTILQNISLFQPDPDMDMVSTACDLAEVASFLPKMRLGLHTLVTPNSTLLSSGEKQRLFLARALYAKASVLLLDEFSGNLDGDLEERIFNNLRLTGKTVIMTAHRQSSIERCDRVLWLDASTREITEVSP
ncbi:peptidase domain-containing ABC transporter [Agrobacterium tumefaciens]|uniref:peptidase domain-containing ABC transporter n=1 Tax=Agrobacterium tumefaciens TaxID=358 RepID=UPI001572DB6E|nr:cysteine peptidase family C39 domain-containing protein [Agrobacterium tumefaciens]NSX94052.1 ATP-binding cassette domain-containing protein [Agrobacterium tumefaciens]